MHICSENEKRKGMAEIINNLTSLTSIAFARIDTIKYLTVVGFRNTEVLSDAMRLKSHQHSL
jgi:hypothetical protein